MFPITWSDLDALFILTSFHPPSKPYIFQRAKSAPAPNTRSESAEHCWYHLLNCWLVLIRAKPDWTWAQCDQCLKWRRMPDGITDKDLPDKWFCRMNRDLTHKYVLHSKSLIWSKFKVAQLSLLITKTVWTAADGHPCCTRCGNTVFWMCTTWGIAGVVRYGLGRC